MQNVNTQTLLLAFVAFTGVAVLLQAVVLFAIFLAMRKTASSLTAKLEELRTTVVPVLNDTKDFLARVGPKIDSVATDLAELAHGFRTQGAELQSSTTEILERVRRQTSRVDTMLSGVLDSVDRAGIVVSEVINTPLRQISAIAAFVKASVGAFRSPNPRPQQTHSSADKDMFV
jgi:hypothetical protein